MVEFNVSVKENFSRIHTEGPNVVFVESDDNQHFSLYAGNVLSPKLIITVEAKSDAELNAKLRKAYSLTPQV